MIWFVVNRILEIVGGDEIAVSRTKKPKDTLKEGRATKRRRKDRLSSDTRKQA